ncbi:ImmA/IrrE family metallo-endopeptidase [Oerskovia turbata]
MIGHRAWLTSAGLDRARSIDEARAIVAARRGKPVDVVDGPLGEGVSGMWISLPDGEKIIVNSEAALSARHRRHIIAHELVHILDACEGLTAGSPHSHLRKGYDDPVEHRAESLASELMMSIEATGGVAHRLMGLERYR